LCHLDFALAAFASLSLSAATAKGGMGIFDPRPRFSLEDAERLTPPVQAAFLCIMSTVVLR